MVYVIKYWYLSMKFSKKYRLVLKILKGNYIILNDTYKSKLEKEGCKNDTNRK